MASSREAVAQDALVLPEKDRLILARQLLESVEAAPEPDAEAAWNEEISRRLERLRTGESKLVPAGEVFAKLRQIAP
jgi:putative addiction module component (TIGR02574 family)